MPKIICDWIICKFNTSYKVGQPGECIKEKEKIKLISLNNENEQEGLECSGYCEDKDKIKRIEEESVKNNEIVQYYIINTDLNMSAGKIAVSATHIAILTALEIPKNWAERTELCYVEWINNGMKKIVLKANTKTIEKLLNKFPYDFYSVRDNGLTEVPKGSITAIGLVPMKREQAKMFVKGLQLLR